MRVVRRTATVAAAAGAAHALAASLPALWMPALSTVGDPGAAFRALSTANSVAHWGTATVLVVAAGFWAARECGARDAATAAVAFAVAGGAASAIGQWVGFAISTAGASSGPIDGWYTLAVAALFGLSGALGVALARQSGGGRDGERGETVSA